MRLRNIVVAAGIVMSWFGTTNVWGQDFATTPKYAERILLTDTLGAKLSQEARMILGRPFNPEQHNATKEQQQLTAFLAAPLVVDALSFSTLKIEAPTLELNPFKKNSWVSRLLHSEEERATKSAYYSLASKWQNAKLMRERLMLTQPDMADLMISDLPGTIKPKEIKSEGYQGELAQTDAPKINTSDVTLKGDKVERKYWWQKLEVNVHFSQNQVSKNWHKGGFNSLNLNSRIYYNATYNRDPLKWVNELEYRLGIFTNQTEDAEKSKLKIGEDLFRFNSNLGVKAFNRWYYTFDSQLRSQIFRNVKGNGNIITQPFAPIVLDAGLGMKYDLDLKKFRDNPYARLRFTANIAPLAFNFIYTYSNEIDKGRIGLQEDEKYRIRLGSSVRLGLNWDISSSLNWSSRVFYNTSYKHIEVEFDNSLSYAFSQFFSTRLTLNTRFDDSVILPEDTPKNFKNLIQYNQLLSLGFDIKF